MRYFCIVINLTFRVVLCEVYNTNFWIIFGQKATLPKTTVFGKVFPPIYRGFTLQRDFLRKNMLKSLKGRFFHGFQYMYSQTIGVNLLTLGIFYYNAGEKTRVQ